MQQGHCWALGHRLNFSFYQSQSSGLYHRLESSWPRHPLLLARKTARESKNKLSVVPPHECRYARRMLLLLQLAMFAMCWGTRSQRLQLTSLGILVLAASTGKQENAMFWGRMRTMKDVACNVQRVSRFEDLMTTLGSDLPFSPFIRLFAHC